VKSSLPYQAILCDIDGVVRHWPSADHIERAHRLPAGIIVTTALSDELVLPAIVGEVTDEEWRRTVADRLVDACGGSATRARLVVETWSALVPAVDHDVVELLTRARTVAKVALISNATTRLESDLERQGLSDLADVVVNTSRIGVAKPDPRAYAIAVELVGVPPEHCLFVDDTHENVVAAREAGMTAVHYRQISDLSGALASLTA
jgi:putative hydrolase of the HAD superfamily